MSVFSIDDLIAKKFTFRIGSKDWIMSELTIGDRAEIANVLRKIAPNPLTEAKLAIRETTSEKVAKEIWKEATRQYGYWPPTLESDEGQGYIFGNAEVQIEILYCSLKRNQPVTRDDVKQLTELIPFQGAMIKLIMFALTGSAGDDPKEV